MNHEDHERSSGVVEPLSGRLSQRVRLECHYGTIGLIETRYGMVFGTEFQNGTLTEPSGIGACSAVPETDLSVTLGVPRAAWGT